ncbi:ATP-binding protein [Amphritea atlantica]|uniref:ATP-binding protein n=1 Tax=Amphritea atlantica TaxID=355243 RepID=A0ABY5GSZ2_9GAMM|nr:ATP-binding protein [Amphritea atlantica]
MIIDLTVENHLSIKEEQTFSMFAEGALPDNSKHSDNISFVDGKIGTLKTAGILGANASGKSNLLHAFKALQYMTTKSSQLEGGDEIPPYEPYLLCPHTRKAPTSLEVEFWLADIRHSYKIQYNQYEITYESLFFYPKGKPAKIFERTNPDNWETDEGISFGTYFKGGKKRVPYFSCNSYLAVAGKRADSPAFLRAIYNYFRKQWDFIFRTNEFMFNFWKDDPESLSAMKCLIRNTDLGIADFEFRSKELSPDQLEILEEVPDEYRKHMIETLKSEIVFMHKSENGELIEFEPGLESLGTKRLLNSLPVILFTLQKGSVLFCDELETSFHPHVVELIIKLFNDKRTNQNNAQLIYTTHSLTTMKSKSMRKDQIWLAEKVGGKTTYVSLDQFDSSLRDSSPFEKWYDEGRLGGIPSINFKDIIDSISSVMEKNTSNA